MVGMIMKRRNLPGVAAVLLLLTSGCSNGPFDIVSVSGDVLYEDGEPLPLGDYQIKFVPKVESPDGKSHARVATGIVGADGKIQSVTSYKYNDGLVVGEHAVYLKLAGGPNAKAAPVEYMRSKTTPLTVDVSASRQLAIRIPRP
ncbi:hypothetical protein MalM25_17950 [Planctomycetes bacterium MalM25]|nr:hypothetical protein MalM25_17950 [Planctomycetes bacterium MalM25]